MINLAIIDTGLNNIKNRKITQITYRILDKRLVELPDFTNHDDHCDIVYKILCCESNVMRRFFNEVNVCIINILDRNLRSNFALLDKAIRFILERDFQLVHMSLSCLRHDKRDYFTNAINKFLVRKCFVICAATSYVSYPSVLEKVISVTDKKTGTVRNRQNREFDFIIDVDAYNYSFIKNPEPSYAAPFVTAKVIDLLYKGSIATITELKKELSLFFSRPVRGTPLLS